MRASIRNVVGCTLLHKNMSPSEKAALKHALSEIDQYKQRIACSKTMKEASSHLGDMFERVGDILYGDEEWEEDSEFPF